MEYRVTVTPQADSDWEMIYRYISGDDPEAAHHFCGELLQQARSLRTFPARAKSLVHRGQVRKIPYKSYLIFFKTNDQDGVVEILRFWHAARDQRRLRLREEPVAYEPAVPNPAHRRRLSERAPPAAA